jgi:hypothetical protein
MILACIGCSNNGEVKIKNGISGTTIENVYWGETYISGPLRPEEESGFRQISRREEKLPARNRIFFSTVGLTSKEFYTAEMFSLSKKQQLVIELSDSTAIIELN